MWEVDSVRDGTLIASISRRGEVFEKVETLLGIFEGFFDWIGWGQDPGLGISKGAEMGLIGGEIRVLN